MKTAYISPTHFAHVEDLPEGGVVKRQRIGDVDVSVGSRRFVGRDLIGPRLRDLSMVGGFLRDY